MKTHVINLRVKFIFIVLLLFAVLVVSYLTLITDLFSYAGMVSDFNLNKFFISCGVIAAAASVVNLRKDSVSGIGQLIILAMMLMPMFAFWACSGRASNMPLVAFLSYSLISVIIFVGKDTKIIVPKVRYINYLVIFISLGLIVLLVVPLLRTGMLSYFSLGITDVYVRREVLSSGRLSALGGYLLAWTSKIIIPALVVYGFVKRKHFLFLGFVFLQLFIFGLTGHKEQLVNIIIVIGMAYFLSKKFNITMKAIKWVFILSLLILILGTLFDNEINIIATALFSRAFFSVAINHFDYYDFFQNNDFVYWSNSFLSVIYDYPFDKTVPQLIGFGRWSAGEANVANAGFIGSGYMHFGVIGVLLYSVVVGFIFKLCDALVSSQQANYQIPICSLGFLQLVNGDLTTSLLSNGIAVMILIIIFLRK